MQGCPVPSYRCRGEGYEFWLLVYLSGGWMKVSLDLRPEMIIPALAARTKDDVLAELSVHVAGNAPGLDREVIFRSLQEREKLGSTGIGDGIAIPHGKLRTIDDIVL